RFTRCRSLTIGVSIFVSRWRPGRSTEKEKRRRAPASRAITWWEITTFSLTRRTARKWQPSCKRECRRNRQRRRHLSCNWLPKCCEIEKTRILKHWPTEKKWTDGYT